MKLNNWECSQCSNDTFPQQMPCKIPCKANLKVNIWLLVITVHVKASKQRHIDPEVTILRSFAIISETQS